MRRMNLDPPRRNRVSAGSRECDADGCRTTTRGAKPYCSQHVALNPYARLVAERLAQAPGREATATD